MVAEAYRLIDQVILTARLFSGLWLNIGLVRDKLIQSSKAGTCFLVTFVVVRIYNSPQNSK